LRVLHEPRTATGEAQASLSTKTVELIFVHGLGGSAKDTWTHADTNGFWPVWLHDDNRLNNVRISIFGYNANFKNVFAPQNALGIADFAKQLLDSLDLHFGKYVEQGAIGLTFN
jgi:hypothetical protein